MKIHITLDYELFFGIRAGTIDNCMLLPTDALLAILNPYDIKATFYVDVGYIESARRLGADLHSVQKVRDQLRYLHDNGHDLQLHIHPHWEDAQYLNGKWSFDVARYKLADFPQRRAEDIINRYVNVFSDIGLPRPIAFRAGGWCIQPFSHIAPALRANGIKIDSTIYYRGKSLSKTHSFDFSSAPAHNTWRFNEDPLQATSDGTFLELPIAEIDINPLFFWRLALIKKLNSSGHRAFGDGNALPMSKKDSLRLLTRGSYSVASLDGYKSTLLEKALKRRMQRLGDDADLVLIGHPKALSRFSLGKLKSFIRKHEEHDFTTVSSWYSKNDTLRASN